MSVLGLSHLKGKLAQKHTPKPTKESLQPPVATKNQRMSHSGAALFRKSAGILTIDESKYPARIHWKSTDGTQVHTIILDQVSKLQATPANSTKMMIKLIGKLTKEEMDEGIIDPVSVFQFNNRMVMENIKNTLQIIISRYKDNVVYEQKMLKEKEHENENNMNLINTESLEDSLSVSNLLSNLQLQQNYLKQDLTLSKKFQNSVIKNKLPAKEFWITRITELRSFALSNSQKFGPYNVLSTIKPVASSDNKVNVSVTKDKLKAILATYPVVKLAFDENVPLNFHEQEFWSRFFQSNLFRKLRGELIMANTRGDIIIDKYLENEITLNSKEDEHNMNKIKVSKVLDLKGNMDDDPLKFPNKQDFTMRYGADPQGQTEGVLDILKGMNRLSEKLMNSLQNEYGRKDENKKRKQDELDNDEGFDDLVEPPKIKYTKIKIQESNLEDNLENADLNSVNLNELGNRMTAQLENIKNELLNEDRKVSLFDFEKHKAACYEANNKILNILDKNQSFINKEDSDNLSSFMNVVYDVNYKKLGIPQEVYDSCSLLNETCNEFLKHFYNHLNTLDPRRSMIIRRLNKHLVQCDVQLNEINKSFKDYDSDVEYMLKPVHQAVKMSLKKFDDCLEK